MPQLATTPLHLTLLSDEQIKTTVYLGDEEKNIELFNALIMGGKEINKHIPNFIEHMINCVVKLSGILSSDTHSFFLLENHVRTGYPFITLAATDGDELINISNGMNWSNVNVPNVEASMILNVLACSYLAEITNNPTEQEFCVFLMDYLKRLADLNYDLNTPNFNSSAFFRVID